MPVLPELTLSGMAGDRAGTKTIAARYRKRLRPALDRLAPWIDPLVDGPVNSALSAATGLA